jgi:hypothetical protein
MKICMNDESIKACELSEESCFDCSYGKIASVARKTDAELVELAGNAFDHINRLASIQETLWMLEKNCSRISKSDKAVLSDSAFKIAGVQADIFMSGLPLYQNLLFNHCSDNNSNAIPVEQCNDQASEQA